MTFFTKHRLKFTSLVALLLTLAFASCNLFFDDDDDDDTSTATTTTLTTPSVSTTGSVSSSAVTTNSSGSKVATLTDSYGGVYTFTETASGSGTWTYQQNNVVKLKYSGTYTGDISEIGSSEEKLNLTINKVTDSSGTLVDVKEEKSFDFVLTETSFSAEIPAVEIASSSSNSDNTGTTTTTGDAATKTAPNAVGDIVLSDGTAVAAEDASSMSSEQKAAAVAVIFYVGSADDTLGEKTLGVGLVHYQSGLAWCKGSAKAYRTNITTIQCEPDSGGDEGNYTWTGSQDKDGSDNLSQIGTFLSSNSSTDDTATEENYPAFYFAKNYARYASYHGSYVSGTDYEDDWYLPTIAELFQIWKNKTTVDAASALCGGSQFESSRGSYWSSSQNASYVNYAYYLNFDNGDLNYYSFRKDYDYNSVCAIREF